MRQGLETKTVQKQAQKMSAQQIKYLDFIMISQTGIDERILSEFESNPTLEIEDGYYESGSLNFDNVLNAYAMDKSLRDDLYLQLLENPHLDYDIMSYLIESLDDCGFLSVSDQSLANELKVDCMCVTKHRNALQHFEPIGIGSQSMKDNIIFQLKNMNHNLSDISVGIINEFLSKNNYDETAIIKYYGIDKDSLDEALNLIHKCIPKFEVEAKESEISIPDAIIRVEHNEITCETSRDYEKIKINYEYKEREDDQIKKWYQESEQLLDQIRFRNSTLLDILQTIIESQIGFFLAQKPLNALTQSQIADKLNFSTSTVSRAIANKVVLFNKEIYPISHFLVSNTTKGDSADAIKKRLLIIVKNETEINSDQKLVDILKEEGFQVERRTVAKYRQELQIPSSSERRRIKKWR